MQYRREIDGLRALAVLPVILFHAGVPGFDGGFVGVDVFFVISGYLITSILLAEQAQGTFSILRFYERRARRILPALYVVMACAVVGAWFVLLPDDMKDFSESLAAVPLFVSNVLFWHQSGYFEKAVDLKPLLHTWSLAVEEQYYLFIPLLLLSLRRWGWVVLQCVLAVLAVGSLALAQKTVHTSHDFAFFLLPTRAWELLAGSMVAVHMAIQAAKPTVPWSVWAQDAAGVLGLGLLAYAVFGFTPETPFPSVYTLVPIVGTALLLLCVTKQGLVGRALGCKPLVGIGLISYSAYLWHQPLLVFARHRVLGELDTPDIVVALALTFGLAYASWRWVEQPVRHARSVSVKWVAAMAVLGGMAFMALGYQGYRTNGFEDRLTGAKGEFIRYYEDSLPEWRYKVREGISEKFRNDCNFYDIAKFRAGAESRVPLPSIADSCYTRDPQKPHAVFVWGDSHAQHLHVGLKDHLPSDWQILQVASSGCAAEVSLNPDPEDYCKHSNWFALRQIAQTKPDIVLIGQNSHHDAQHMQALGTELLRLGVRRVVFAGPAPHWRADLPEIAAYKLWDERPRHTWVGLNTTKVDTDRSVKAAFPHSASMQYVSLIDYFCNEQGCQVYLGDDMSTGLTSWDYGHLTPMASRAFARDVLVPLLVR